MVKRICLNPGKKGMALFICLSIILVNCAIYRQVSDFGFTNWDDNEYVTHNPIVGQGLTIESVSWAFDLDAKHFYWQPLTWLSHMLDVELFGMKAGSHHLVSVLFHTINSLLIFTILASLTGKLWESGFVALLFAAHPLNVESVAWIAERKNVLSTFLWLLTTLTYIRYATSPSLARYLSTLVVFALGLLAKPMLATLPFTLLLLDFWPLRRLNLGQLPAGSSEQVSRIEPASLPGLVAEKIPFLALAITVVLIVSNNTPTVTLEDMPLGLRITNAITSYWHYLSKMIMPVDLAMYYPYPTEIQILPTIGAALWIVCTTVVILWSYKSRPYLTMGWLWYLGTLVPVLGIIQAGFWPKVADRWAYVPTIGLFVMIAWGIPELFQKQRYKKALLTVIGITAIFSIARVSWLQTRYWSDDITLFTRALEVGSGHPLIFNNLGAALKKENRLDEAVLYFQAALQQSQDHAMAHNNLGMVLKKLDRPSEAIKHFLEVLRIDPENSAAKKNLENILKRKGSLEKQIEKYLEELEQTPNSAMLYNKLAATYAKLGLIDEAVESYATALDKDPAHKKSYNDLGVTLLRQGYTTEAIVVFKKALEIDPKYEEARKNLAFAEKIPPQKKASELIVNNNNFPEHSVVIR